MRLSKERVKRSQKGRVLLSLLTSMQQVLECKLYPDPEHLRMIRFSHRISFNAPKPEVLQGKNRGNSGEERARP